jgi:hypothetical protein
LHPPSADHLHEIFPTLHETTEPLDDEAQRLANQLKHLKLSTPMAMPVISKTPDLVWERDEIKTGDSSVVVFSHDSESNVIAVKTSKKPECDELIRSEAAILEALKHPLVLEMRGRLSKTDDGRASIVTEYAGLGSLVSFLRGESRLCGANKIAKVIAGIALAMRFVTPAVSRTAIFSQTTFCFTGTGVCGSPTSAVASPPRALRGMAPMDFIRANRRTFAIWHPSALTRLSFAQAMFSRLG